MHRFLSPGVYNVVVRIKNAVSVCSPPPTVVAVQGMEIVGISTRMTTFMCSMYYILKSLLKNEP